MALSKETLNKTLQVLESEIAELYSSEKDIYSVLKERTFGNFKINRIERSYRYSQDEDDNYEVTFRSINKEIDYSFQICTKRSIDSINWSSWSFRNIKQEELVNTIKISKAYIEAVHESLVIMEDTSNIMKVVNEVVAEYVENINPLTIKIYDLQRERDAIQQEILNIDNNDLVEKALELFSKPVYLYKSYQFNNNNRLHVLQVEKVKDKLKINVNGTNRTISEYELLCMYNHAIKTLKNYTTDSDKDYDSEGYYTYYKCDNMFLTLEEANTPVRTIITKEEYDSIRR